MKVNSEEINEECLILCQNLGKILENENLLVSLQAIFILLQTGYSQLSKENKKSFLKGITQFAFDASREFRENTD